MNQCRLGLMPNIRDNLKIFSQAFDCSPSPMRIFRLSDGITLDINTSYEKILGYKREEIIGTNPIKRGLWFDCDIDSQTIPWLLQNESSIRGLKANIRKKDGSIIPVAINLDKLEVGSEQLGLIAFEDLSVYEGYKTSLLESEEKFYNIFNNNPDPLAIYDIATLSIIEANVAFERQLGYSREESCGLKASELLKESKVLQELELNMISIGKLENREVEVVNKWGETISLLLSADVIEFGGRQCYLVSGRDITARKKMSRDLARLERFNLIGQMSASIGHEIRNPMTTVKGFLQLLGNEEQDSRKKDFYELMISEMNRVSLIISEFLDLAHDKARRMELRDLNNILESINPLLASDTLKQDKMLNMELGTIQKVMIDDKEIRQLILNLFKNGLEAMNKGGLITIRTYMENGQVVLMIKDSGSGIDPALAEMIGNPFFSTKENGTGLGLAVCYSIANRHNAELEYTSDSAGTTFYARFPIPQ
ncbi:MAG TPA: PAS domain S-box protein [Bacillota bacterium]|nr:PAS domain S-box protein [Bacillota bacterium]